MQETEPIYFKEFRKELKNRFDRIDKNFAKKSDLELMQVDFEQHITDLNSGFNEKIKGVCDQVASLSEKLTRVETRVIGMDQKLTHVASDVFRIKNVLKEKTNKKDTLTLKRRINRLNA